MARVEKLVKRFDITLKESNNYEAHQIARTVYYRWLEAGEFEKLRTFLFECTMKFSEAKEDTIALDLAQLYAQTVAKGALPVEEPILQQIQKLFTSLPSHLPADAALKDSDRRVPIANMLVNWSLESPSASSVEKQYGSARLHAILGDAYHETGDLQSARNHYILSLEPESLANVMIEYVQKLQNRRVDEEEFDEPVTDADHLAALTALQVLSIGRLGVATAFLHSFTARYQDYGQRPPYSSAVLNAVWLLGFAVQNNSLVHFTEIVEVYRPTLALDSRLLFLVDRAGQCFFKLPRRPEPASGGILGALMKGLVTKPEKPASKSPVEFVPDDMDFLSGHAITPEAFPSAWEAAARMNPPGSVLEPEFVDAVEDQPTTQAVAQAGMDLD